MLQRCRTILAPYIIYRQGGVGMGKVFQLVILQPLYSVGEGLILTTDSRCGVQNVSDT